MGIDDSCTNRKVVKRTAMKDIVHYWKRIYESRYFWIHLARVDLINKFRRSKLGLLWVCVNPLCLTVIMSVVFGTAFHQDVATYAPYILSGIICWTIFTDSYVAGANVIIGSAPYISQFNHPITIYPLKCALAEIVSFFISSFALGIWVLFINPTNVLLGYLTFLPTLVIFFVFAWCSTIIAAYVGTKYRDYPQLAALLLQTIWYLSPVFFQQEMFEGNIYLHKIFIWNPITHMLQLVRAPFLYGRMAGVNDYLITIAFVIAVALLAYAINRKEEREIIFYT